MQSKFKIRSKEELTVRVSISRMPGSSILRLTERGAFSSKGDDKITFRFRCGTKRRVMIPAEMKIELSLKKDGWDAWEIVPIETRLVHLKPAHVHVVNLNDQQLLRENGIPFRFTMGAEIRYPNDIEARARVITPTYTVLPFDPLPPKVTTMIAERGISPDEEEADTTEEDERCEEVHPDPEEEKGERADEERDTRSSSEPPRKRRRNEGGRTGKNERRGGERGK